MSEDQKEKKPNIRSSDFRMQYATTFGIKANDNEIYMNLGTEQNIDGTEVILNHTQIIMSLRGTKTLHAILNEVISHLETQIGPIQLAPGKIEEILSTLKSSPRLIENDKKP